MWKWRAWVATDSVESTGLPVSVFELGSIKRRLWLLPTQHVTPRLQFAGADIGIKHYTYHINLPVS
jgi:hypothetical protein